MAYSLTSFLPFSDVDEMLRTPTLSLSILNLTHAFAGGDSFAGTAPYKRSNLSVPDFSVIYYKVEPAGLKVIP